MAAPTSVRLPATTESRLSKCAIWSGIPQREIIRVAVFEFLEANSSAKAVIESVAAYRRSTNGKRRV